MPKPTTLDETIALLNKKAPPPSHVCQSCAVEDLDWKYDRCACGFIACRPCSDRHAAMWGGVASATCRHTRCDAPSRDTDDGTLPRLTHRARFAIHLFGVSYTTVVPHGAAPAERKQA